MMSILARPIIVDDYHHPKFNEKAPAKQIANPFSAIAPLGMRCGLLLCCHPLFAANPVLHLLDHAFPAEVTLPGSSYTATYTFTNNLPLAFKKPFLVSSTICPVAGENCTAETSEFTYDDQCSGKKLASHESCTYQIRLTPKTRGRKTIQITYLGYDNNVVSVTPFLTTTTPTSGLIGSITFPSGQALPSRAYTNTNYQVIFSFTNYGPDTLSFSENNQFTHFTITSDTCNTGILASNQTCKVIGNFNTADLGSYSLSSQLVGAVSTNVLTTSTTTQNFAFNGLIGVDYNPNHYSSNSPFNFHDIFYTGTQNNPSATNTYSEMQQLQEAGFTAVRSYQTEPYSWIDIINSANLLGMKVIYEANIPQQPNDSLGDCPMFPKEKKNFILCAQATLNAVYNAVGADVFNSTVVLVFAGHENYCDAGNSTPPCNGHSNVAYLVNAVDGLKMTTSAPVGSALVSGNLTTPSTSISDDMVKLIGSYSQTAPLGFDPYPFQWGVSPTTSAVWNPPLSTNVQLTNSLAWDYIQVVGSATPAALPDSLQPKRFYSQSRVLLSAETGWATAGSTAGYACNSPGPCAPSLSNAVSYFQALYQRNTNNFVETSGYSIGVLAFEAYDEPAKPGPTAEQHYGLFDQNCNQKAAGLVPNNHLVTAKGCQEYINGTLLTINGIIPPTQPTQPTFNVEIQYAGGQYPKIKAKIPPNTGANLTVTPWPQFLVFSGAIITVSSSSSSCTVTANTVTPSPSSISFSQVRCDTSSHASMNCSGTNCSISNPF
jgi:hypothetical protein